MLGTPGKPDRLKRVLIVEDDASLRTLYAEGLAMDGFEIVAVQDGLEAFEAFLLQGPFEAIVADCDMPRLDGRQLLRRLRERGEGTPALLISGREELNPAEQRALGVGRVLRKPFTLDRLTEVVKDLIAGRLAEA